MGGGVGWGGALNDLKFVAFITRFLSEGAACMAVKGLSLGVLTLFLWPK